MLSFFPLDVLDEIWDVIESVSEGFLTYSLIIIIAFVFVGIILNLGNNFKCVFFASVVNVSLIVHIALYVLMFLFLCLNSV